MITAAHKKEMLNPYSIPMQQFGYFDLVSSLEGFIGSWRHSTTFIVPDFKNKEDTKRFYRACFETANYVQTLFPKEEGKRVAYIQEIFHSNGLEEREFVQIVLYLKYYDEVIYTNRQIYNAETIIPWLLCCRHMRLPAEIGYCVALYLNDLPFKLPRLK